MTDQFSLRQNPTAEEALAGFRLGRFPHAILIEGPAGSGKSTFARRLAMAALCRDETDAPCGVCPACKKVAGEIHPDLLVYTGEKSKQKSFHVDQVRALRAQAYVAPNEGERKVLLLEDAHLMTEQAQNALLKVLEEPPASAVFLITCLGRGQLLETIRSRAVSVSLRCPDIPVCAEILADILADKLPERTAEELLAAAQDAGGSVGLALEALAGEEGDARQAAGHRDCARELLALLEEGAESAALARLRVYERDRPGFAAMLEAFSAALAQRLLGEEEGILTPAQLVRLAGVADEMAAAARSNVGGLLLGSALVAGAMDALKK